MEEASPSSKHVQAPTRPWRSRVSDPPPVIFTKVKANQKTLASTGLPSPKPARPSQLSWVSRAPSQGYLYGYKLLVPDAYKLETLNQPLHSTKCNQSCLQRESFSAHELGLLVKTKPNQNSFKKQRTKTCLDLKLHQKQPGGAARKLEQNPHLNLLESRPF